jgi:amidase
LLDASAGGDRGAPFLIPAPADCWLEETRRHPGKLRIAFSTRSPVDMGVHPEAVSAVEETTRLLQSLGHEVEPAEPAVDGGMVARCFITMYFGQVAASVREACVLYGAKESDFEADTRTFALLGRTISAADYVESHRRWNTIARAMGDFLSRYDLYLTPTLAYPPCRIGELELPAWQKLGQKLVLAAGAGSLLLKSGIVDELASESLKLVPFTQLANLSGLPAMSVPLHWTAEGLPMGVQFVAGFGEEGRLFRLAAQLEQAKPWFSRRPRI